MDIAIRSVTGQAYPNLEYFVFDGGSTDNSADIIRANADRIDHWQCEPDGGQSDAIATGFEKSTGEILGWINSDDALFPGALAAVGEAFARNPSTDVFCFGYAYLDDKGTITKCHDPIVPRARLARRGVLRLCQQATFFRRSVYERVGGLRRDFHFLMDTELWIRILAEGGQFGVVDHLVGAFRWHGDMKSIHRDGRKAEEMAMLGELHRFIPTGIGATLCRIEQAANGLVSGAYWRGLVRTRSLKGKSIQGIWS